MIDARELRRRDYRKYVNNHYMTRDSVIPFYIDLILSDIDPHGKDVRRVNDLILSKWKLSGLLYIKDKAWKEIEAWKQSKPFAFTAI